MYGVCKCSGSDLPNLERDLIAHFRNGNGDASEPGLHGPRCCNIGRGGERLPLATAAMFEGWVYVVVRDRHSVPPWWSVAGQERARGVSLSTPPPIEAQGSLAIRARAGLDDPDAEVNFNAESLLSDGP